MAARDFAQGVTGRVAGLAFIVACAVLRLWDPAPMQFIRGLAYDAYHQVRPFTAPDRPVAIVDIDDASLADIGQWPWSRFTLAKLVHALREQGAAAVAFDVIFPEPDRVSPKRIIETLDITDPAVAASFAQLPDSDAAFAESMKSFPTVLGQAGTPKEGSPVPIDLPKTSFAMLGGDPKSAVLQFPGLLTNILPLEQAASGHGLITVNPDGDGTIRRVPLIAWAVDRFVPALSIELLRAAAGASTVLVKRDALGLTSLVVAGVEIPTDFDGQLWVHFGHHDPGRFVSAKDVLKGTLEKGRLEGKLVLVGTSAVGLSDLRSTPLDNVLPGVEIHAQIIENILCGATLTRPNYATGAEVLVAALLGIGIVVALPMLGPIAVLGLGAIIVTLITGTAWYLFEAKRLYVDIAYPIVSCGMLYVLLTFGNYFKEAKSKIQIRNAFRQYLSPELVEELSRNPEKLSLGGEVREMTVLFSDVRGFTGISETYKQNPEGLIKLLNRLMSPISEAIIERRGTIDKYMGDAVMAFWNAPLQAENHPALAVRAALSIVDRVEALNRDLEREAIATGSIFIPLEIGVGIGTGLAFVGNMGSDQRFDYSVIGDSVNLSSRLEGLTARYGVKILLSAETARRCADEFALIEVDQVKVKGRDTLETIYTALGGATRKHAQGFASFQSAIQRMQTHIAAGNIAEAEIALAEALAVKDEAVRLEKLLDVYRARIKAKAQQHDHA